MFIHSSTFEAECHGEVVQRISELRLWQSNLATITSDPMNTRRLPGTRLISISWSVANALESSSCPPAVAKRLSRSRWPWLLPQHVSSGGRVLWLTHRRSLLIQAFNSFMSAAHLAVPKEHLRLIAVSGKDRSWSMVSARHDIVFSTVQARRGTKESTRSKSCSTSPPKGCSW